MINSDTQCSLFTGCSGRERGEIRLFIGGGPFHKVQSFIIWVEAVGGMWLGARGLRDTAIKTCCDLVTGRTYRGGKFKQGEETSRQCSRKYPAFEQMPLSLIVCSVTIHATNHKFICFRNRMIFVITISLSCFFNADWSPFCESALTQAPFWSIGLPSIIAWCWGKGNL